VLTCVAFIACAAAYYWGTKSNYNSGYDDGKAKGRREVEREVERKTKEQEREVERRREEQEREREREKMWEDWRRRRGAEAVARNAAAANNGRATNNSAAARNAFHTNYRADKPVRGRTDSSSRPQPEGRTPRDRYWTTPLQYHPTTASQAPMINNQRKTPTWSAQPPLSRRSASTSQSQNLKPSRNAVPLSLASRHGRGTSRGPSRKPRVASAHRAEQARASTATERFENAATRPFPQNQRFEPAEPRRGSSSRPEHIRAESAGEAARGQVAARRRDGSVDGAEEWGGERRREGLEEAVLGDGVDGAAGDVNGGLRRASPAEGDGAPSPSLRRRSASLWGERSVARSESSASAAGSEEKAQDEEERASGDLDEGRWPHSDVERNKVEKSAWSRSSSPWGEPLSPRGEPRSPGNDGNTTAGSGETAQDKEDQEVGLAEEGHWPGSKWEGDEEGRSSRSRSPSPLDSPRTKSQSGGSDHSAADNGERGQNKEERATGVADEARWPDPERERTGMRNGGRQEVVLRRHEKSFGVSLHRLRGIVLRRRGVERGVRMRWSGKWGFRMRGVGRVLRRIGIGMRGRGLGRRFWERGYGTSKSLLLRNRKERGINEHKEGGRQAQERMITEAWQRTWGAQELVLVVGVRFGNLEWLAWGCLMEL